MRGDSITSTLAPAARTPSATAYAVVSTCPHDDQVVHPLNACDIWCCRNTETTGHAMAPSATPNKRMLVGVPVIGGALHGLLDLGPCLEATPLQRKGAQHLPPRLQQVQIGGIDRLEYKLPTRVGQREQQHVHGGVGIVIVHHRIDLFNGRIDPPLDL